MAPPFTARAASCRASDRVGWEKTIMPRSSALVPNSMPIAPLNQFCSARANHMDAQYAVSLGISNDFHETAGIVGCHGTATGCERESADVNFNAFGFQGLLGFTDPRDFRVKIG